MIPSVDLYLAQNSQTVQISGSKATNRSYKSKGCVKVKDTAFGLSHIKSQDISGEVTNSLPRQFSLPDNP